MTISSPTPRPRHWTDYIIAIGTLLAALIAAVAAGLTGWQLHLSETNNARELRAYLVMIVDEISEKDNDPNDMHVHFHVANVGQTPAHRVETAVTTSKISLKAIKEAEIAERLSKQEGISIIGGDDRSPFRVPLKLKSEDVRKLDAKNERMYVYGIVKYIDIYNKVHLLKFCRYLRGNIKEAQFLSCDHFNSAD